jgi:hypothetical protein
MDNSRMDSPKNQTSTYKRHKSADLSAGNHLAIEVRQREMAGGA